jgi:hypothetical protein
MSIERLHNVTEVRCAYCHERGSISLLMDAAHMLMRFDVDRRIYYIHQKCMNAIIAEWIKKYGPKIDG